jgi:CRP-like cAMP-binding protein
VTPIPFDTTHLVWALLLGGLSAASLPMGSALGVMTRPSARVTGTAAAFGAGALIAALAVELVAPTVNAFVARGHGDGHGGGAHGDPSTSFALLILGALVGGILFVTLNELVNRSGGFLRKSATKVAYFTKRRAALEQEIVRDLANVAMLREVPPELVGELVRQVRIATFTDGETLFSQGQPGSAMHFIKSGTIELEHDGESFKELEAGDIVGEIALVTGASRTATANAHGAVMTYVLHRKDFAQLRKKSPELDRAVRQLASERIDELRSRREEAHGARDEWARDAAHALRTGVYVPSESEVQEAASEHGGAPLAIWLGILLDGIPESFVIGTGLMTLLSAKVASGAAAGSIDFASVVPFTLIAGLFLSNFPEAMSSSVGMKAQGMSTKRVLLLWGSLTVMTAVGSALGYLVGESLPPEIVVGIEGLAAGAMLTMIAATMLPEAVHLGGGNVVGLSALSGFLAAIAFKVFE